MLRLRGRAYPTHHRTSASAHAPRSHPRNNTITLPAARKQLGASLPGEGSTGPPTGNQPSRHTHGHTQHITWSPWSATRNGGKPPHTCSHPSIDPVRPDQAAATVSPARAAADTKSSYRHTGCFRPRSRVSRRRARAARRCRPPARRGDRSASTRRAESRSHTNQPTRRRYDTMTSIRAPTSSRLVAHVWSSTQPPRF